MWGTRYAATCSVPPAAEGVSARVRTGIPVSTQTLSSPRSPPPKLGALGCGMRAILLSRKDFKRSAADEAAGRPPVDDARWREVATVHLTPYALLHLLRLTPHTLHNTPHASHLFYTLRLTPRTSHLTCYLPPATCHLPPLLTGARCATCTRLRRCCASGGRSNAAALGWWTQSLP